MRRAPFLAVLGLPVIVIAAVSAGSGQVVEVNNFDAVEKNSYINAAQCAGGALDLEWSIALVSGSFTGAGDFRIFASDTGPATTGDNANFCPEESNETGNPQVFADQVGTFPADTAVQDAEVSGSTVARVAHVACDSTGEGKVVHVCSHWYESPTSRRGHASGRFVVQVAAPAKPTITSVGSGDGRLEVSWDPGENGTVEADSYVASATTVAGGPVVASATTDRESVSIDGLTNFTTYRVVVQGVSIGGNLSDPSFAVSGTPAPSAGFMGVYRDRGGVEQGGCATGSAGALALLAAASLLALRRRKP